MNFTYESQDIPFIFNINNNFDNFEVDNQLIKIRPNLYSDIFLLAPVTEVVITIMWA